VELRRNSGGPVAHHVHRLAAVARVAERVEAGPAGLGDRRGRRVGFDLRVAHHAHVDQVDVDPLGLDHVAREPDLFALGVERPDDDDAHPRRLRRARAIVG
jgi:hypothetical protein